MGMTVRVNLDPFLILFLTTFRRENTMSTCFKENDPTTESSEPLADENIVFMNESDNIMKLHASAL